MKDITKLPTKSIYLSVLVLFSILILLFPSIIRISHNEPVFSGTSFYYELRTSQDLSEGIYWDSLAGRPHEISLYHYLLPLILNIIPLDYLFIISIILGAISLLLFHKILSSFFKNKFFVLLSSLLLMLSPIFIYIFTTFNEITLATFFSLLFIYFYTKKNYLSVIFLILSGLTDASFFFVLIFLIIIFNLNMRNNKLFYTNLSLGLFSLILFGLYHPGFILIGKIFSSPSLLNYMTSFGAKIGIAFFYFFMGIIGLFNMWKRNPRFVSFFMALIVIVIFSFFNPVGRVFLTLILSFLSAYVIIVLIERKWAIITIKKFTLLLVFCGILFSTALYLDQKIGSQPSDDLLVVLDRLSLQEDGVVLSHESQGSFIQFFANKPSFLDDRSYYQDEYFVKKDIEQKIFHSRNLELTSSLIIENNIKYFLITPEMKDGLVWSREQEGLLFLLNNAPEFNKLLEYNNISLWRYDLMSAN